MQDVGVTAYKGAVQVLQSQTYATVASGIEAVEAGHAAIIRYQLYQVMHICCACLLEVCAAVCSVQ